LSKRFGKKLSARRLQIGSHKTRLFDIVSENLEIVGEIKEYKYREDYYGTYEDRILGTCYRLHMLSDSTPCRDRIRKSSKIMPQRLINNLSEI